MNTKEDNWHMKTFISVLSGNANVLSGNIWNSFSCFNKPLIQQLGEESEMWDSTLFRIERCLYEVIQLFFQLNYLFAEFVNRILAPTPYNMPSEENAEKRTINGVSLQMEREFHDRLKPRE